MTLRAKLELAAAIVAAIAAVLGFRSWLLEHDLRMKTQAMVESQQKILDQSTDQAKQLSAARAKADEQTAAQIDAMKAAVAKIRPPRRSRNGSRSRSPARQLRSKLDCRRRRPRILRPMRS